MVTKSITGQINTEFVKFNKNPEKFCEIFLLILTEDAEANIVSTSKLNEKMGTIYFTHGNATVAKWMIITILSLTDQKETKLMQLIYWITNDLENSGFGSHFGIQYLVDKKELLDKVGFDDKLPQISQNKYGSKY